MPPREGGGIFLQAQRLLPQLRFLFASYPALMGKAPGIVYRTIATWLIHQAGFTHDTARTGVVTFIQRFGSAWGDSVWLFGLEGTLEEASPADTPLVPVVSMTEEVTGEPALAQGAEVYRVTCLQCHGEDGQGGHGGGAPLTSTQIRDVAAFVMATFSP